MVHRHPGTKGHQMKGETASFACKGECRPGCVVSSNACEIKC